MKNWTLLAFSILLLSATSVRAQDDPCASTLPLNDYWDELTGQISAEVSQGTPAAVTEATAAAETATANQLAKRADADGFGGSKLDLLHRAFVGLGLGQVDEKEGQLIFNFNPQMLNFPSLGQFSPRVIVHDPALFEPLLQHVDTLADAQSRKDKIEDGLGDLDDVEAQFQWVNASDTPRALVQELANDIFQPAYQRAAQQRMAELAKEAAQANQTITQALGRPAAAAPVPEICAAPAARERFLQLVADLREKGKSALTDLHTALTEDEFFNLADLIEGEPRWSADGSYRRRADAAGPDEGSLSLRYDLGHVSYHAFKSWAQGAGKPLDGASVQEYLKATRGSQAVPKISFSLDYSEVSSLKVPLTGMDPFRQPDSHKISGVVRAGWYLLGGRNSRLELDATYDDVTDDPARQDRFVSTLSWVEKLNPELAQIVGGTNLVVTLVYADKPEFRGEVDKDLGLRFGVKWSFDGGENGGLALPAARK